MTQPLSVRPHLYSMFGAAEGAQFCLVTHSRLLDQFSFDESGDYTAYNKIAFDPTDDLDSLLAKLPEPSHVLVVLPDRLFESPTPDKVGRRKLAVMPCASTHMTPESIRPALEMLERVDIPTMQAVADRFFDVGQQGDQLEIVDAGYGTRATFAHLNDDYEWFEQAGAIDWGGQQFAPCGEISVLPLFHGRYDSRLSFPINGEIAIKGCPILHSGRPSHLANDQARLHGQLATMTDHAIIATVHEGWITDLKATHPTVRPAVDTLNRMIEIDSRYALIWEVGFGINHTSDLISGNVATNEVYGGRYGSIHWGLGLTPWTQYHLDIVCPGTRITVGGKRLIGPPTAESTGAIPEDAPAGAVPRDAPAGAVPGDAPAGAMSRTGSHACPCITG